MGWNEPTQKKEKKMTYIHCDIRDGVDVKKPKSISRIIDGPQKVKKLKLSMALRGTSTIPSPSCR